MILIVMIVTNDNSNNDRNTSKPEVTLGPGALTGVREKKAPPEKKTLGKISLAETESGAGEEVLLSDSRAKA